MVLQSVAIPLNSTEPGNNEQTQRQALELEGASPENARSHVVRSTIQLLKEFPWELLQDSSYIPNIFHMYSIYLLKTFVQSQTFTFWQKSAIHCTKLDPSATQEFVDRNRASATQECGVLLSLPMRLHQFISINGEYL